MGCGGRPLSHGGAVTAPLTQGSLLGRGLRIATGALRPRNDIVFQEVRCKTGGGLWSARPTHDMKCGKRGVGDAASYGGLQVVRRGGAMWASPPTARNKGCGKRCGGGA